MASTTRTATDWFTNGTAQGGPMGMGSDVVRSVDEVTTILVMSILTPVLCMKVFIKRYFGGWCEREDKMLFCAWVATMAYCVIALLMARHGGGNHEREVSAPDLMIFKKLLYANTIIYGPAAFFTKTSLLLIFTRVFAHARRAVLFIYVIIGVMACYYVPILLLKIRLCTPIAGLWDPTVDVKCFNKQSIFFTDSIVSVITGAVVLLLPGPLVCTLNVSWRKKLRIAALLGAGGLSTIASIWRAALVWAPDAYEDITVTFVRVNLLGIAEVSIGILCACIPTFNLLFTHYAKERRKTNADSEVSSDQSPDLEMKRLSDDENKVNLWKGGHTYGVSLGSDVDSISEESGGRSDLRKSQRVVVVDVISEESGDRSEARDSKGVDFIEDVIEHVGEWEPQEIPYRIKEVERRLSLIEEDVDIIEDVEEEVQQEIPYEIEEVERRLSLIEEDVDIIEDVGEELQQEIPYKIKEVERRLSLIEEDVIVIEDDEEELEQEINDPWRRGLSCIEEDVESQAESEVGGQGHHQTQIENGRTSVVQGDGQRWGGENPNWPLSGWEPLAARSEEGGFF